MAPLAMASQPQIKCSQRMAAFLAAALLSACASTSESPVTPARISDSAWFMNAASFGIPASVKPTLEFNAGRLLAHSGCNRAAGPYKDVGGRIEAGPLASTRMGCRDDINAFEIRYYRLLSATPTYRIEGNTLTLTAGNDEVRFARSEAAGR